MRIPPYYNQPNWQRFFAGVFFGAIISWFVFLYMFGVLQEEQIQKISQQENTIEDLKDDIQIWKKDYQELNEQNQDKLTLQEINIEVINNRSIGVDSLNLLKWQQATKNDISHLVAKDIESVYESKDLLKRTIENKVFTLDNKQYHFKVREIFLYTTLVIDLELKVVN